MDLLGWIMVGLLAGALARLVMPGRDPGGCVVTILLGIAGALLAGFVEMGCVRPEARVSIINGPIGLMRRDLRRWLCATRPAPGGRP